MEQELTWWEGTKQCVEANLHQLKLGVIDSQKARNQIMAHIKTLIKIESEKKDLIKDNQ